MQEEVLNFINYILNINYNLEDKLVIDSITFIKLIVALECEFNFEFDENKLIISNYPKIKNLVDYVVKKIESN